MWMGAISSIHLFPDGRLDGTAERQEVRPMTWIRLESERYPPPAPTVDDQPIIDAEYRVIHEPQERPRWRWRARRAEPRPASRADLMPALKAALRAALRASSMLAPFWTIRVLLIILLWPVAYLVRMTAVTLACLMILMRPFICAGNNDRQERHAPCCRAAR